MNVNNIVQPIISVIMPTFNVEDYIETAIDSLLDQNMSAIQIIVVDDGSSDSTRPIVEKYATEHENIKILYQNNKGPGAARNLGLTYAEGKYIAFMDGDDFVPKSAYEKMLNTIIETNSDIVVGNVKRFNLTKGVFASGLHKKIFKNNVYNTHIYEHPELLYDTTSWNKLFKKEFIINNNLKFPENVLYEDIPFNMRAHILSSSTDIIVDVVYHWRLRDSGDKDKSITQSRENQQNFLDRIKMMSKFNDIVEAQPNVPSTFIKAKELKELTLDLMLYLDNIKNFDEDYKAIFVEKVKDYLSSLKSDVRKNGLKAIDKIKYRLVELNEIDELINFIHFQKRQLKKQRVRKRGGRYYIQYDQLKDKLPLEYFDVTNDLRGISKIEQITYNNNKLVINGLAYIEKINIPNRKNIDIKAKLRSVDSGKEINLPIELVKNKRNTRKYGGVYKNSLISRMYNYDWSSFECVIDFDKNEIMEQVTNLVEVVFCITARGVQREIVIGNPLKGRKARVKPKIVNNHLVTVRYNSAWELTIQSKEIQGSILEFSTDQSDFILKGIIGNNNENYAISMVNWSNKIFEDIPVEFIKDNNLNETKFEARIKLDYLKENYLSTGFIVYLKNLKTNTYENLPIRPGSFTSYYITGKNELRCKRLNNNNLRFWMLSNIAPLLQQYSYKDHVMSFEIKYHKNLLLNFDHIVSEKVFMVSRNTGEKIELFNGRSNQNNNFHYINFTIEFSDHLLSKLGESVWDIYHSLNGNFGDEKILINQKIHPSKYEKIDQVHFGDFRVTVRRSSSHTLELKTKLIWTGIENGPRRRKVIEKVLYPLFRFLPMNKKMVMFESFWGKGFNCNPKSIYEYIQENYKEYTCIWSFNNEFTEISGNGIKVRKKGWKYFYYLARAKYFVNNVNWPNYYKKRRKAVEIQTLHGTFLKTMGLDVPGETDTPKKLAGFRLRHGRWDYLVSPSSYMTNISRRVFEFNGKMLEYGFPRNDLLINKNSKSMSWLHSLKEKINIPKDKKVILYAPTYRTKKGFKLELELEKMQEALGDEYIVLLRLHYFVAKKLNIDEYDGFAYNVSNYPDIQELYLITDILITDYSSVMFDFAILNRPILFFTYDLEYYADVLRGMYIDFKKDAPGPLLRTTDEICENIKNIENVEENFKDKMKEFRSKFNEFETGHASEKIVNEVIVNKK